MRKLLAIVCFVGLVSGIIFGRDLSKKTGVGFNSQLSGLNVDSLSVRHWFSKKTAAEGLLGFSMGDNTIFNLGGKFLTVIKEEKNLNLYGFGIIGVESYEIETGNVKTDDSSLTVGGGFGSEFFFSDFPNLGFSAEIGINFNDNGDKSQFGTSAGWLSAVGIRYYL